MTTTFPTDRPTIPAGACLDEAAHAYLAEAGLTGRRSARDVYEALRGTRGITESGAELLRLRAAEGTLRGQWARTAARHLGVEVDCG